MLSFCMLFAPFCSFSDHFIEFRVGFDCYVLEVFADGVLDFCVQCVGVGVVLNDDADEIAGSV